MTEPADLWGVADDVEELAESWQPDVDAEAPSEAFTDTDGWVARRLAALRFTHAEIESTSAAYRAEIERLERDLAQLVGHPTHTVGETVHRATGLHRQIESLEGQLMAFHAAAIAQAEAAYRALPAGKRPKNPKLPTTIRSTQGRLRSGAGGRYRVKVESEELAGAVVAWLEDNGFTEAVNVIPEQRRLDGRVAPGLVTVNEDGEAGIFNAKGEPCPHLRFERPSRWFKVDLPETTA